MGGDGGDGCGDGGGESCSGQPTPSSGRTIAKQYPRFTVSVSVFTPPSSTLNDDTPVISYDTMAGSIAADGDMVSVKSTGTLMLVVASAYSASDGANMPPSSVDDGVIVLLVAPSTDTSSRTP